MEARADTGPRERVADLCDRTLVRLGDNEAATSIEVIRRRLSTPLRVAVAGRVSAGKSTLVNAFLGKIAAPTAAGECTKVVTLYRYGYPTRANLILADGTVQALELRDERLPDSLPVPVDAVELLSVELSNDDLNELEVLDTPGLASATDAHLPTERALQEVDALLYVVAQGGPRQDDAEVLAAFRQHTAGAHVAAVNVVIVLNKVDLLAANGRDPLELGEQLAARSLERLEGHVTSAAPLIGIVAEAIETGQLTEATAGELRTLARLDESGRRRLLLGLSVDCPVSEQRVEELRRKLGVFGLGRALELIDAGSEHPATMSEGLLSVSGIARLRHEIRTTFRGRSDPLKAQVALAALTEISRDAFDPVLRGLASECSRVAKELGLEALPLLADAERIGLPEPLHHELAALALEPTAAGKLRLPASAGADEQKTAIFAATARWKEFAFGGVANVHQKRLAEDVVDVLAGLYETIG